MKELWSTILDKIRARVGDEIYEAWFQATDQYSFDENVLKIVTPNEFVRERLEEHYSSLVVSVARDLNLADLRVVFTTNAENNGARHMKKQIKATKNALAAKTNGKQEYNGFGQFMLKSEYTFDTFVVGSGNQFAHAAARAVAEAPAFAYNPLFIYGGVGLGKTHLMHSIGHMVKEKYPEKKLIYLPAEMFMNEMINAFRFSAVTEFREKYRSIDILMIDDIQYLAGKDRTQMEFFHTFNTLYESKRQIVISSDMFPKDIPTLEERLRSRFEWGLIADIQPPDLETKIAILFKKAELKNMQIDTEVAMFIAENVQSNIRQLEGCLNRLHAISKVSHQSIDIHFARQVLRDLVIPEEQQISIELIQKTVSKHFGIKFSSMKSKTRTKDIAYPRQIAMYLCRELTTFSLPDIGKQFGGKDHSTILYAYEKIKKKLKTDIALKKNIEILRSAMNAP